jgi:UDPglucose 6-dehydrogenase
LLKSSGLKKDTPILLTGPSEAEAIKLFSNSYLALRLAFFNELDTFAFSKKLETEDLINGICMDPRIGNFYNNPSFGYGGYCLPKDVKQLSANFDGISQAMISATIVSNEQRKKFIANYLNNHPAEKIGIYRLTMKQGSDNIREAALLNVISLLKEKNKQISIYEPYLDSNVFMGINVIHDFNKFINSNDLIVTNRITPELASIKKEIFSRDIFNVN